MLYVALQGGDTYKQSWRHALCLRGGIDIAIRQTYVGRLHTKIREESPEQQILVHPNLESVQVHCCTKMLTCSNDVFCLAVRIVAFG